MKFPFLNISIFLTLFSCAVTHKKIKHVVVLMMENRSFDHLLGYLQNVDGLHGDEYNFVDSTNSTSKKIFVNKHGYDISLSDPLHDFDSITEQIYGAKTIDENAQPKMNGFVQNAYHAGASTINPMSMFDEDAAPIISTLAKEFAVMNRWFCSIPGPTDPNRQFAMSGTSQGILSNFDGNLYKQQSYFDFLQNENKSWRAVYQDDPWAIIYFEDILKNPTNLKNVIDMDRFFNDLKVNDYLAEFTWLQPRMTSHKGHPTWQHPDASVREGERLIKSVYEALRASSYWENLVFVLTYDEHGGFYDHVSPPSTDIPSPDNIPAENGFTFNRLGVRIPTIIVSPWVEKGTSVYEPDHGPTKTSQYDATSTIATTNKILGINQNEKKYSNSTVISNRVKWAGTFDHLFDELNDPRPDCPLTLPELPKSSDLELKAIQNLPLNDHLEGQVMLYCLLNDEEVNHKDSIEVSISKDNNIVDGINSNGMCGEGIVTQLDASLFIEKSVQKLFGNINGDVRLNSDDSKEHYSRIEVIFTSYTFVVGSIIITVGAAAFVLVFNVNSQGNEEEENEFYRSL